MTKTKMKISVAMIVKNEEVMLSRCLKSVSDADEIVVVDTGSTDRTIEIAKRFTDKVFTDYKWNDNFAEARNHSLSKCTGDWILIIDADEYLKPGTIEEIRKNLRGFKGKAVSFKTVAHSSKEYHYMIRLFKNGEGIHYKGAAHEYLNITEDEKWEIELFYDYSPTHKKDPNRILRILLKDVTENPDRVREKYYLAREYLYRKDYHKAIEWYEKYLEKSVFLPEKADAYLMLAHCYWQLHKGDKARMAVLKAIEINANFKEALLFMAEMSWPHNAKRWKQFAELADNSNVLFVRTT